MYNASLLLMGIQEALELCPVTCISVFLSLNLTTGSYYVILYHSCVAVGFGPINSLFLVLCVLLKLLCD